MSFVFHHLEKVKKRMIKNYMRNNHTTDTIIFAVRKGRNNLIKIIGLCYFVLYFNIKWELLKQKKKKKKQMYFI